MCKKINCDLLTFKKINSIYRNVSGNDPANKTRGNKMKFTVKAFRAALKANDQTLVWKLAARSLRHTPDRKDVYELIKKHSNTIRDSKKAYSMAYESQRKQRIQAAETLAWHKRGAYGQYGDRHYRIDALAMLRRLASENVSSYTKVPMLGHTRLYFCSPSYGHSDYNKVRTCAIEGNEAFCNKVIDLGERIFAKKSA